MYFNEFVQDNITYSVDMLRLKTFLTVEEFSRLEFHFNTIYKKYIEKKYTSPKITSFFYNYHIVIDENKSFWFGFMHNTEKRSLNHKEKYNFTVEFNPNKLKDSELILYILKLSLNWFLVSYDLSFDLKININDIIYNQYRKRHIEIFSNGFDDKTIRIGKNNGKIKIYNKKKESNLDISYDLTRVEVSRILDDYEIKSLVDLDFGEQYLPQIYLNNYLYSFSDYKDKTLFAILFAIQNGFPFNQLTRTYKNKINKLFEGGYKINFSNKIATNVLRNVLLFYFRYNAYVF